MKEKLSDLLGGLGVVLYYIISSLIYIMPFVMIGTSFWLDLLFFGILQFFPAASIIFWIWGLIAAIKGVQDLWAIVYYVLFTIMFLPFFISIIIDLFKAIALNKKGVNRQYTTPIEAGKHSTRKGVIRIVIGIILVILQSISIAGNNIAGSVPMLPAISSAQFAYDSAFYLSYYSVGIIGVLLLISGLCAYFNIRFFDKGKSNEPYPIRNTEASYPEEKHEQPPRPIRKKPLFTWILLVISVCIISLCLLQISNYQQTIDDLESTISELNDTVEMKNQLIKQMFSESEQYRSKYMELSLTLYFYEKHIVFISENDPRHYHKYGCSLFDRSDPFWACNTERTKQYAIIPCEECCK